MGWPKGKKREKGSVTGNAGKGRVKGVPNKTTLSVKESILKVFELIGGVPAFAEWAKNNTTEYYKIHAKLLPKELEVTGQDGGPIQTQVKVSFIGTDTRNPG